MNSRKPVKFDELLAMEKAKKPRKVQGHQESDIQISCVKWFRLQYPRYIIFAVPNGGTRKKVEMVFMLQEGILPGVADLIICGDRGKILFVEMKTKTGRQSPHQKDFEEKVTKLGFQYNICRSLEDFMHTVREWINKVRWE